MCVLSSIYIYVRSLYSGSVQYVVSLLFASLCNFLMFVNIFVVFAFLFCIFAFYFVYSVLCIVSPSVYICPFPIPVPVYRPLSPAGNPIAVNKYHITNVLLRHLGLAKKKKLSPSPKPRVTLY